MRAPHPHHPRQARQSHQPRHPALAAAAAAALFLALSLGGTAGSGTDPAAAPAAEAHDAPTATLPLPAHGMVTCDELPPTTDVAVPDVGSLLRQVPTVLPACPAAIRPGAGSNACTLNFIVTDGTDLYIGAAGHCSSVGKRLRVSGVPGEVGTAVLSRSQLNNGGRDWAFYRIDPEDRHRVDPTMCRWGGPTTNALGEGARIPVPGEVVLHYGRGAAMGTMENFRGRAGVVLAPDPVQPIFAFAASLAGGDSGSPVRFATGEAAGIAVAVGLPGYAPNYGIATRFDAAMADLEAHLGRPVRLVDGDPLPTLT